MNNENFKALSLLWTDHSPVFAWEILAGLPPHWVTSPLKALGRICAVTQAVGRVEVDKRR